MFLRTSKHTPICFAVVLGPVEWFKLVVDSPGPMGLCFYYGQHGPLTLGETMNVHVMNLLLHAKVSCQESDNTEYIRGQAELIASVMFDSEQFSDISDLADTIAKMIR